MSHLNPNTQEGGWYQEGYLAGQQDAYARISELMRDQLELPTTQMVANQANILHWLLDLIRQHTP